MSIQSRTPYHAALGGYSINRDYGSTLARNAATLQGSPTVLPYRPSLLYPSLVGVVAVPIVPIVGPLGLQKGAGGPVPLGPPKELRNAKR